MLVTFSSDSSTHYDGFAAEYWCAPAGSVRLGCPDRTASNYDPTARFQGSSSLCEYGPERRKQQAALLGAFVGHEAWSGISGWTDGSGDPCAAGAAWEGLTCDGQGRVTRIGLYGKSGELYGPALAELAQLEGLCAPVNPRLPLRLGFAI